MDGSEKTMTTTVCIQDDEPPTCSEAVLAKRIRTSEPKSSCVYCANLTENAERAWSVMSSFVHQLSQMQSLENENQQLSRINEEQQVYMANQRQRYQTIEDELLRSNNKVRELEERLSCVNAQYREVLSKGTEAQEAANMWRQKYTISQELVMELERKATENHKMHISSLAVAASFSKSHDAMEAQNVSLVAKVAELERKNEELHRKVSDLECRTRLLEKKGNRRESRKEKYAPLSNSISADMDMPPPPEPVFSLPQLSISEIFECSFFKEVNFQSLLDPYKVDTGVLMEPIAEPEKEAAPETETARVSEAATEAASETKRVPEVTRIFELELEEDDDSDHVLHIVEDASSCSNR